MFTCNMFDYESHTDHGRAGDEPWGDEGVIYSHELIFYTYVSSYLVVSVLSSITKKKW